MNLRSLAHCLVLALFLTANLLSALISPAQAGIGAPGAMDTAMEAGMPCCPPDDNKAPDCARHCPAMIFCLAKSFTGTIDTDFADVRLPMIAVIASGDDGVRASHLPELPARPPRTVSTAGA